MKKEPILTLLPGRERIAVQGNSNLLEILRQLGRASDAPCGGVGTCGKCKVLIDGVPRKACQTIVDRDMVVQLPEIPDPVILSGIAEEAYPVDADITGNLAAIDLGTTTMVCYLLDCQGRELAVASALNPQRMYGADVISRIQAAQSGRRKELCKLVRRGLSELISKVCDEAGTQADTVERIALVGNPCMQQLLMDRSLENLVRIPFAPVLTEARWIPAGEMFPLCPNAEFLVVPDLSGYVGADTMGCILATEMYNKDAVTLLVDIGTNGEMVLGNRHRMLACATAAGPALEGANIRFGMGGSTGAIDHVTLEPDGPKVHVIGEGTAAGICGSGLIDAVALMLKNGILNQRGRIQSTKEEFEGDRAFYLTDTVCITQKDIRQVQLAKGAIAAGIRLMANQLGIQWEDIDEVLLAGAFGSYMDPVSACEIGLLPPALLPKIRRAGNAAGSGAKLLAGSRDHQRLANRLVKKIEFLELASLPDFQRIFGKETNFPRKEE